MIPVVPRFLLRYLIVFLSVVMIPLPLAAQPASPQVCDPQRLCPISPSPDNTLAVFTLRPSVPQGFEVVIPPLPPLSPPIRYVWMMMVSADVPLTVTITSAQGTETVADVRPPIGRTIVQSSPDTPLVTTVTVRSDSAAVSGSFVLWRADDRLPPTASPSPSQPAAATIDPFEPNGDAIQAVPVAMDVPYRATLRCPLIRPDGTDACIDGDHDFYVVTAVPRRQYLLTAQADDPVARPVVRIITFRSVLSRPDRYPTIPWSPIPPLDPTALPFVEIASALPSSSTHASAPAITTIRWETPESSQPTIPLFIVVSSEYRGTTDRILSQLTDVEPSYHAAYTLRISTADPSDSSPPPSQRNGYAGDAVTVSDAPLYLDPPPVPDGTRPLLIIPARSPIRVLGPQIVINTDVWVAVQPLDRVVQGWIREHAIRVITSQEPVASPVSPTPASPTAPYTEYPPTGPVGTPGGTGAGQPISDPIPPPIFSIPDTGFSADPASGGSPEIASDPLSLWNRSTPVAPAPPDGQPPRDEVVATACFLRHPSTPLAHTPVWVVHGVSAVPIYRFLTAADGCVRLAVDISATDHPVLVLPAVPFALPISYLPDSSAITIVLSEPQGVSVEP
jgi:hypothetical protein